MSSRFFIVYPQETGHDHKRGQTTVELQLPGTSTYGQGILPQIVHLQIEFFVAGERVKKDKRTRYLRVVSPELKEGM